MGGGAARAGLVRTVGGQALPLVLDTSDVTGSSLCPCVGLGIVRQSIIHSFIHSISVNVCNVTRKHVVIPFSVFQSTL